MQRAYKLSIAALCLTVAIPAAAQNRPSFFITSAGHGKGAELGGLEGADRHCAQLAEAAGITG
jgi:hypothetical protein